MTEKINDNSRGDTVKKRSISLREYVLQELRALKTRMKKKERVRDSNQQIFGIVSKTLKGEIVRSKSEKKIADFLFRYNIKYEYEPTLKLGNNLVKPDFYLPKKGIYVEFWGLVSKADYAERMEWKMNLYQQFQVKILSLFQDDLYNIEKYISKKLGH